MGTSYHAFCACTALAAVIGVPACGRGIAKPPSADAPLGVPVAQLEPAPPAPQDALRARAAPDLAGLVARVAPAVVSIEATRIEPADAHDLAEMLGLRSGPAGEAGPLRKTRAAGSGFIIASDGLVVTNEHVVHEADEIRIRLADDREVLAELVAHDEKLDLALLRVAGTRDLPVLPLGTSQRVRVGDQVVAIGNPFGLGTSVTFGIVSAKSRALGAGPYDAFIQTDARIDPGYSGGPLLDLAGRVVGIATALHGEGRGLGFAIPIDDLSEVLPELRATGGVRRGRLGIAFQAVDEDLAAALGLASAHGALVNDVEADGPAARAGLLPRDVIESIDGVPVHHASELARQLGRRKPGQSVKLRMLRSGKARSARVVLAPAVEAPSESHAALAKRREHPREGAPATDRLGIRLADAPGGGARVDAIDGTGPSAGELEPGDVIVELDGREVEKAGDLDSRLRAGVSPGTALLRVKRDDSMVYVAIRFR